MNIFKISLLSLILLFAFGGALAQGEAQKEAALDENIRAEDLEVQEPTLLPDNPFYFLKNLGRGIQSFFTFDPVKKAKLRQKFANEKLIELKKLSEQGKGAEVIQRAAESYRKEVKKMKEAAEKIKERAEESERVGVFLDKFIQHQALHQRVLQKLEEQVPPEAFEKISEARERHLEGFGEVMTKLEENKEKLRERLENNLQKIKGSEFKEFKNLEILKELEEKVPEAARKAIREAKENTLRKLKIKIEQLPQETLEKFKAYTETISGAKEKQMEILENLKERLQEKPAIMEKIIESKEGIRARIEVKEREKTMENTAACIQLWDPVCGKDGKTYSNKCFAKLAGVEVAHEGVCPSTGTKTKTQTQNLTPTTETPTKEAPTTNAAEAIRKQMEATQQQLKQLQEQLKIQR